MIGVAVVDILPDLAHFLDARAVEVAVVELFVGREEISCEFWWYRARDDAT